MKNIIKEITIELTSDEIYDSKDIECIIKFKPEDDEDPHRCEEGFTLFLRKGPKEEVLIAESKKHKNEEVFGGVFYEFYKWLF